MTKRPRRSGAETRGEILAKAEDLFRSHGYAKTSVADVAMSLGMSPANVFKHFPSKMALAEAISAVHLERIQQAIGAIPATLAPSDRLRRLAGALLDSHLSNMRGNPHVFDIVIAMVATKPAHIRAFDTYLHDTVLTILLDGNERGDFAVTDLAGTADTILDCLAGTSHPLLVEHGDERLLREGQARTLDFVIAALRRCLVR